MRIQLLLLSALITAPAFADIPKVNPDFRFRAEHPVLTGKDPHWLQDTKSGCWLFDGNPAPQETVEWTGTCQDQLASGDGTASFYQGGKLYIKNTGSFTRGSLTGQGLSVSGTGNVYEGGFAYGARYGHGVLKQPNGGQYSGNWPGSGTYTLPDGTKCVGRVIRVQRFFVIEAPCAAKD